MTFPEIWSRLKRKRPSLEDDDAIVEFTAANLWKLLRQVYEQGQDATAKRPESSPSLDMFSEMFGGRGR